MNKIAAIVIAALLLAAPAVGQPKKKKAPPTDTSDTSAAPEDGAAHLKGKARVIGKTRKGEKEKLFDFTGFELSGSTRMPQLLYFLDRANQELERASLQRRSFVPEMVRSLEEDAL